MSLNSCHTQDGSGIVLFLGERLLINYDGCDLKLSGENDQPKGSYKGRVFLTSHRVLFLPSKIKLNFNSLSMPFVYMKQVDIKQPTFGANRIQGFIIAESGGWAGRLPFSFTFNRGGAIEFGKALLELGSRASKQQNSFKPPPVPSAPDFYACPPPAYAPPYNDPYYNFMTPHPSFGPPMPDMLYQYNYPPPYPGATPPAYTPTWEGNPTVPAAPYPQNGPYNGTSSGPVAPSYPPGSNIMPMQADLPYPSSGASFYPTGSSGMPQQAAPPYPGSAVNQGYYFQQNPHNVYSPAADGEFAQPSAPPEEKKNI